MLVVSAALVVAPAGAAGAADALDPVIDPPVVPDPAGLAVPARAAACAGAATRPSRVRLSALRAALLCLVNRARARYGLRRLRRDGHLARAAGAHARDMGRRHYFAHQRSGGRSLPGRARAAGWRGSALGEAIAYGCGRPAAAAAIVRTWLASSVHRAILLSARFRQAGVGVVKRAPVRCRGGATWVLDTGRS